MNIQKMSNSTFAFFFLSSQSFVKGVELYKIPIKREVKSKREGIETPGDD